MLWNVVIYDFIRLNSGCDCHQVKLGQIAAKEKGFCGNYVYYIECGWRCTWVGWGGGAERSSRVMVTSGRIEGLIGSVFCFCHTPQFPRGQCLSVSRFHLWRIFICLLCCNMFSLLATIFIAIVFKLCMLRISLFHLQFNWVGVGFIW